MIKLQMGTTKIQFSQYCRKLSIDTVICTRYTSSVTIDPRTQPKIAVTLKAGLTKESSIRGRISFDTIFTQSNGKRFSTKSGSNTRR